MVQHHRGNALIETILALLTLSPLVTGMVLLGKQLDVKHKTYDAVRYSAWERTVWSERGTNAKSTDDIAIEVLDRAFGDPRVGITSVDTLRTEGVSRNPLWSEGRRSLLNGSTGSAIATSHATEDSPVRVGHTLVPGIASGDGFAGNVIDALQLRDLELNDRTFFTFTVSANLRPLLADEVLNQSAHGTVLSDAWSPRDETDFAGKADHITANEHMETLELPGRPLSLQAPRKGAPLYGEGQYSWDADLRPRSNTLPSAYVTERQDD